MEPDRPALTKRVAEVIEAKLWDWLDDRTEVNEAQFASLLAEEVMGMVCPVASEQS